MVLAGSTGEEPKKAAACCIASASNHGKRSANLPTYITSCPYIQVSLLNGVVLSSPAAPAKQKKTVGQPAGHDVDG